MNTVGNSAESPISSNLDTNEIAKFERMAHSWWDVDGPFKPLHKMNPVRANFIDLHAPVAEKNVLDIGCGGGLLCEALAQRGAHVTGIDMGAEPLKVAKLHAETQQLNIRYKQQTAEQCCEAENGTFDIVTCLEMLEHVPDPSRIVQACAKLVKPGGHVFFSTINRNIKSYAMAVLAAEYVLKWVPKGTHEYGKFIRPSELACWARANNLQMQNVVGMVFNPLTQTFRVSQTDVGCNYIAHFKRPQE